MNYREDIDFLRAVSIIAVILFHFFDEIFYNGYLGVDVFFIISGYLISKQIFIGIENKTFKIRDFYERRARRILPLFFFIVSTSLIFSIFILLPFELFNFSKSIISASLFFSNFYFWKKINYFDNDTLSEPLLHTWSLAIEEQFYIFFPIFIILFYPLLKKKIFFIILIIFLVSLISYISLFDTFKDEVFYFPFTRAWELLLGYFLYELEKIKINIKINQHLIFIIILIILIYPIKLDFGPYLRIIICLATFLFLNRSRKISKIYKLNIFLIIGKLSFSLYMWHYIFLSFNHILNLNIPKLIIIIATLIFSFFTYYYIEKKFRNRNKTSFKKLISFLSINFLIIIFAVVIIYNKNGNVIDHQSQNNDLLHFDISSHKNYVIRNFDNFRDASFENNKKMNVLIIGDSQAQDFTNIFLEINNIDNINLSTKYISVECLNLFLEKSLITKLIPYFCKKENQYYDEDLINRIQKSNYIYLASLWGENHLKFVKNSLENLENITDSKIIFVGLKNFNFPGIRSLIQLDKNDLEDYKFPLNAKSKFINLELKKTKLNFIDLQELYCNDLNYCQLFYNNKLISFDTNHLTKNGVEFFSNKLLDDSRVNLKNTYKLDLK